MIKRLLLITAATVGFVHGAAVTVQDFSFEQADQAAGGWTNTIGPNWQGRDGEGDGDAFMEYIDNAGTPFASHDNEHIGMATGYYIAQDLGVAWAPNTTYTLTVGYGRRDGNTSANNVSTFGLLNFVPALAGYADTAAVLLDAGAIGFGTANASTLAADLTFGDATLMFSTGAVAPTGNVVVFLGDNSDAARSHFDNIRLDASPIPEPSVALLGALAGLALLRRRR